MAGVYSQREISQWHVRAEMERVVKNRKEKNGRDEQEANKTGEL